jgi:O-antigen/teichoic acid export membrane protein
MTGYGWSNEVSKREDKTMKRNSILTTWGLVATFAIAAISPVFARGAALQQSKNNMRNLAIGSAAIAAYGLLNHNGAATVLGVAGAALAGSQYEKDRKKQSKINSYRSHYYRNHRRYHRR